MPLSAAQLQALLDLISNRSSFTPETTIYIALHAGTHITTEATSGQNQLITNHQIPDNTVIAIDPTGVNEAATVSSSTGSGPYTHTLSGNLSNTHAVDVEVEFAPSLVDGDGFTEPDDTSYARQSATNATFWAAASGNAPASAVSAAEVDFGTANAAYKSGITHAAIFDNATKGAGTCLEVFTLATKQTPASGNGIVIASGALTRELGKSTDTFSE